MNFISFLESYFSQFESLMNYLEDVIEVRVESINMELDKLKENTIFAIDLLENRLIKKMHSKRSRKIKLLVKMREFKENIVRKNIGIFYNEFNEDNEWYKKDINIFHELNSAKTSENSNILSFLEILKQS